MTAKQNAMSAANGAGNPNHDPAALNETPPAETPADFDNWDGWEHVSGPRTQPCSVYRRRIEEPPGILLVVDGRPVFIPQSPHEMIATVLAQVAELVAAGAEHRATHAAPEAPSRPAAPSRPRASGPAAVAGQPPPPPPRRQFPGDEPWPGEVPAPQVIGTPVYLADPALREKFGNALAMRLNRRPPSLNGWQDVGKIVGPQPPHRPGLWELFPGLGGAPHADQGRMIQAAVEVFQQMGYSVEDGHVYVGRPGAP